VIDVEPLIARELGRLVPEPAGKRADWSDVVGRAGFHPTRRRLVLAFAVLAGVLVTAGAVAKTMGGFGDWLSGTPGKPASNAAQQRFEAANGRSWASFPKTTKLRELIRTDAGRENYVLYGFRSGNSLCVQLAASSFARQLKSCAPASTLANLSSPMLVLTGDYTLFDRGARPFAEVSFGIVADGVRRVDVSATDGDHQAKLGGNAYLFVESRPNTANRIHSVSATGPAGRRTFVRVDSLRGLGPSGGGPDPTNGGERAATRVDRDPGFPGLGVPGIPGGPTKVEARIPHPRVRWSERGEKRGLPSIGGLRFVKPDPLSDLAVGLSGGDCLYAVDSSGSLAATSCGELFGMGPINVLISCPLCGEFSEVRGVAADGVHRVVIFLSGGGTQRVPLRHNVFAARVANAHFPIRVVGYDARDRVVATQLWAAWRNLRLAVPLRARRLHEVRRSTGPFGATARLLVGRRVRGIQCWRVEFSTGLARGSCHAPDYSRPKTNVELVQPAGGDLFFVGQAASRVVRIDVRFGNHDVVQARPVAGHFVAAVPRAHLSERQQRAVVEAFDREGFRTRSQRVFFRLP
jgi:hypothetical protein